MADALTLDYRWSEGSVPPPGHYRVRIRLGPGGATVDLSPGYAGHDPPTWTVALDVTAADRRALAAALDAAGLFDADWTPPDRRRIGGSGWALDATQGDRTACLPRDAASETGDADAVEAAVRGLVPDAVWSDLRARRRAYVAAQR